ncbi:hypothetical protein [uncultured Gemmobacter sp.]|uniref:hypothetical protein n=1 Tax=uncultured Gemmobacter sp. TaxID=1095917 RepID=UPI000B1B2629|nr:hypothetical protein [uncultured Gemmobacter sp.]
MEQPVTGGSYIRDPATGVLTREGETAPDATPSPEVEPGTPAEPVKPVKKVR